MTHAFEGVVDPNVVNVILDIETRVRNRFSSGSPEIWSKLDHLRNFKNLIFFRSLTDKALRLFE